MDYGINNHLKITPIKPIANIGDKKIDSSLDDKAFEKLFEEAKRTSVAGVGMPKDLLIGLIDSFGAIDKEDEKAAREQEEVRDISTNNSNTVSRVIESSNSAPVKIFRRNPYGKK